MYCDDTRAGTQVAQPVRSHQPAADQCAEPGGFDAPSVDVRFQAPGRRGPMTHSQANMLWILRNVPGVDLNQSLSVPTAACPRSPAPRPGAHPTNSRVVPGRRGTAADRLGEVVAGLTVASGASPPAPGRRGTPNPLASAGGPPSGRAPP